MRTTSLGKKKRCADRAGSLYVLTLPSLHLVSVVFGTAIPTSFCIFEKRVFYSGALRTGSTKIAAKICNIFGIDSKKYKGVIDQRLRYIESIALSNFHDVMYTNHAH